MTFDQWLDRPWRWVKRRMAPSASGAAAGPVNILGDRDVEWSWVASQMPDGPGRALDFGSGGSFLGLIAAQRGFEVAALDLGPVDPPYAHPRLGAIQGDVLGIPPPKDKFDLVINCSTVEHVGLAGRYGVTVSRPDGDLEAMARLGEFMKPGGMMLLTVPTGRDAVFAPLCRVYGAGRLPRLLQGYSVRKECYWAKDERNRWVLCGKDAVWSLEAWAGSDDPLHNRYALGCFVLERP